MHTAHILQGRMRPEGTESDVIRMRKPVWKFKKKFIMQKVKQKMSTCCYNNLFVV